MSGEVVSFYVSRSGELLRFKGFYIAIRDGVVVDKDRDFFKLVERLRSKYGELADIIVDYIPEKPVELVI